jgi:hypothetical protein
VAKDFLLVIGDREPLAWILTDERMAFTHGRSQLVEGDRLFLYVTRGCFHRPSRDRGRIIGEATVAGPVKSLPEPVVFGDRAFPFGCDLQITGLAARDTGPDLRDLVGKLHLFPDPQTWSVRLRRVLVSLDAHDAAILHSELAPLMKSPPVNRAGYLERSRSESEAIKHLANLDSS